MNLRNLTTLCYIEENDAYLMLHRIKKKKDVNKDKWIGIGGHLEEGESPEECLLREVKEETGLTLLNWKFRGLITFCADRWPVEYMCLYTSDAFAGRLIDCDEGVLEWVKKEDMYKLPLWEGDKVFLRLLEDRQEFFSMKLTYEGETLTGVWLDGKRIQ